MYWTSLFLEMSCPAGGTSQTISSAGEPGGSKGASGRRSPMAAAPITSWCINTYSRTWDGGTSDGVFLVVVRVTESAGALD